MLLVCYYTNHSHCSGLTPGVTQMEAAETIAETLRSDQAALTRLRGAFVLSANSSEIRNETVCAEH